MWLLVGLISPPGAVADEQGAAEAAATYLESTQSADGSWGAGSVQPLYTSEAVIALRAIGRRGPAYYRGMAWLQNQALANTDYIARRILALHAHGVDISADRTALEDSFSVDPLLVSTPWSGWGLSSAYRASTLDTAIVVLGLGETDFGGEVVPDVLDAIAFLIVTQPLGADLGWSTTVGAHSTPDLPGDPVVTALVLRAYAKARAVVTGHEPSGDDAVSFLQGAVTLGSPPLHQAHASLALLRWIPGTALADSWLDALVASQSLPEGSWQSDVYVTAVALQALAAYLGADDPSLQEPILVADLGLRTALNAALGKSRGDAITRGEALTLTSLDANGLGIEDLTGIEELENLTAVTLVGNAIGDLSPLDAMPNLESAQVSILCDVDLDGSIGVSDVLKTVRSLSGATALSIAERTGADVAPAGSPDRVVDAGDALLVSRGAKGESPFPCGN